MDPYKCYLLIIFYILVNHNVDVIDVNKFDDNLPQEFILINKCIDHF